MIRTPNSAQTALTATLTAGAGSMSLLSVSAFPSLTSTALTGTASSTGTVVTGTSTLFSSELSVGDTIHSGSNATHQTRTVMQINGNGSLVVDRAFSPDLSGASLTKGDYCFASIIKPSTGAIEHVKITHISGTAATIQRAQDGTSAQSFAIGDLVQARINGQAVQEVGARMASEVAQWLYHIGINVRWYGALGNGTADDTASIQAAIDAMYAAGGGVVWFPQTSSYYKITSPIYLKSKVSLIGIGMPKIKNDAAVGAFMTGSIFAPGNFHPAYWALVTKDAATTAEGSNQVTVADASGYAVGDTVFINSTSSHGGTPLPEYMQAAKVISKAGNTLTISHPIEYASTCVIAKTDQAGVNGRFSKPLFMYADARIENFEIDTWDYWTADSATYNVTFKNIAGKAKSVVYGNTFCYTTFEDISITFSGKVSELSFGSHDVIGKNIVATAQASGVSVSDMLSWQESGRRCVFEGFKLFLNQAATPSTILRIIDHQESMVRDADLYIYSNANNILALEQYGQTGAPAQKRCGYEDIRVHVASAAAIVCDVYKQATTSQLDEPILRNIQYIGPAPSTAAIRLRSVDASNTLVGADISMKSNVAAAVSMTNSSGHRMRLDGDFSFSDIATSAAQNKISLRNTSRRAAHAQSTVSTADQLITSTTPNNVVKTITFPAGALRTSDRVRIRVSGNTSGLNNSKIVQIGLIDETATYQYVEMAAGAPDQILFNMEAELTIRSNTIAMIWSTIAKDTTVTASRANGTVANISANALTLEVRAWLVNAADGLNLGRLDVILEDITD
jgi:hypothetical protein